MIIYGRSEQHRRIRQTSRTGITCRGVILFGSYATGKPQKDSDVDLFIIASFEGRSVDQSVKIRMKLRPPFPVDLIIRTPDNIRRRLEMGDDFVKSILQEGKVLYEADNS